MSSKTVSAPQVVDRNWWILLAIGSLYVGFGIAGGVIQGAMPPILRAQGYSVGAVGWLFALYLPFGISFLWASYIDRFAIPFLGRRTGWIVMMQLGAVLGILVLSGGSDLPLEALFAIALLSVFCLATMDIALDALSVEQIAPDWRPKGAAIKLAALGIGGILGGGLFVPLFNWIGWSGAFICLGIAMGVVALPILTLTQADRRQSQNRKVVDSGEKQGSPSLLSGLRDRELRNRLLIVTVSCSIIFPLAGLNRIMLVDIGLPLERIGWIVGTLGPLSMMVTAVIAMPLMQKLGLVRTLYAFALVCLIALAALLFGYLMQSEIIATTGTTLLTGAVSGMFVAMLAKIIGWSNGDQPATDYAAYYGISRFVSTAATIAVAQLIPLIGWPALYLAGLVAIPLVVLFLRNILIEGTS